MEIELADSNTRHEQPTMGLRWLKRVGDGGHYSMTLQRAWTIRDASGERLEWRDISVVEQSSEAE